MFKVALCGNPNCGKTTLFNNLTGSQAHVGNWPGVTVEKREGLYQHKKDFPEPIDVVDLPGIYSLSPYTPEEVVSRNFLLNENPDVVINLVDATNLARNLFLTSQVLEMDVPVVIAVNFMDVLRKKGDTIDIEELSKKLGVPVIPVSALKGTGMKDLIRSVYALKGTERKGSLQLGDPTMQQTVLKVKEICEKEKIPSPLFVASKLLEQDQIVINQYQRVSEEANQIIRQNELSTDAKDIEEKIADDRYSFISDQLYPCYHRGVKAPKISASDRADKILTNRWLGIPIFALIMYFGFSIVFDSDFLHLGAMGLGPVRPFFEEQNPGLPSLGILLQDTLDWLLNTWLTGWIRTGLGNAGCVSWGISLICDGILGSVFSVVTFLPLIVLLSLFIQILENSGYMARVAFVFDRLLRRFGISGRCVVPLISCFGCAVPGIMGTRTIDNQREKVLTISLTPFFACGAKLPIFMAIGTEVIYVLSGGVIDGGLTAFILYALGILVAIFAGYLSNEYVIQGESSPFIMEFPPYLVPQFKSTMLALWDETKKFLKRAGTIIALMSAVLWFLQNFGWNWQMVAADSSGNPDLSQSILYSIGVFLQPLFYPLGFTKGADGWKYIVASFTGLIAKEQVVATMNGLGVLHDGMTTEADIGITIPAAFSFLAYNLLTLPCIAAISTAKAELKSRRNFHYVLLFWLIVSYTVSAFIYGIGSLSLIGTEGFGTLELVMSILSFVFLFALLAFIFVNKLRKKKGKSPIHLFGFIVEDPSNDAIRALSGEASGVDTSEGDASFANRALGSSDAGSSRHAGCDCHK
jgi:ferrous iron transport protein B